MDDSVSTAKRSFALRVFNTVIGGVRSTVENYTHGVLTVLNLGYRRKVPPAENDLLYLSAGALAERIRKGELSSESVVRAYIKRIGEVNGLINAVVEGRYAEAIQEAKNVDMLIQQKVVPEAQIAEQWPLLGVPFTAKEAILIKGLPSTCGLVCRKGMFADEDSEPVVMMRRCGAIPLALTNTSEVCMWWETYNKLHGRTNNPYDTTRTVGGSSGGEAALIASAGSVIGLGTDLGGSIRLPAFFNGIYGHKPTQGTVPRGGQFPPALDEIAPFVVVGPMTRYATDLKLVLSALVGREATEKLQLFTPVDIRKIKVYYMLDDGGAASTSPVSEDIKTAIKKALSVLTMEGCVIESTTIKNIKHGFLIWLGNLSTVKQQRITELMHGGIKSLEDEDTPSSQMEMWRWLSGKSDNTFPVILNACAQDVLAPLVKKPMDFFIQYGNRLKQELLTLLTSPEPSILIYPTFPYEAAHHGQIMANPFNTSYSVVFNAIGFPSTQVALGLSRRGLPVGMQVVTAPGNDRLSLAVAELLEKKLGGWIPPSL